MMSTRFTSLRSALDKPLRRAVQNQSRSSFKLSSRHFSETQSAKQSWGRVIARRAVAFAAGLGAVTAANYAFCQDPNLATGDKASSTSDKLTLDVLYHPKNAVNFGGKPPRIVAWHTDGDHFVEMRTENGKQRLFKVHSITGEAQPLYDVETIQQAFARLPDLDVAKLMEKGTFTFSPDERSVSIEFDNDLFFFNFDTAKADKLTNNGDAKLKVPQFSPDGTRIAFVRDWDLVVVDVSTGDEIQLTTGGHENLLNGVFDWVYQEEIYGRGNFRAFWWSPDSKNIAFLQLDESAIPSYSVVDHLPVHLKLEVSRYPKAGDENPKAKLAVIPANGGELRWVDTSAYPTEDLLITRVGWSPDASKVLYQAQNKEQTWLDLNCVAVTESNPSSGMQSTRLLREVSPAWVNVTGEPKWLADGSFLWLSERSGFQHVYHYTDSGEQLRQVTEGEALQVQEFHGIDTDEQWIYFSSSAGTPDKHVYRVRLDGSDLTQLTEASGHHVVSFNKDCTMFTDKWSNIDTPTVTTVHSADGTSLRVVDAGPPPTDDSKRYLDSLGQVTFQQVPAGDGFEMNAMFIYPPDFDPAKKYPVLLYQYSGPAAPQVHNRWGGYVLWHHFLAQHGYVVMTLDCRSSSSKGAKYVWPIHRNFAESEMKDIEDGMTWLKDQTFVDPSRIGIWGWSYGGYMTAYALTHSKTFKMGIAGAPVTDWGLYNTIYTERYMGDPNNHPEGYKKSSVIKAAEDLNGRLLAIHGTMDDNVHMQQTIQLVEALQQNGKQFDLMLYPAARHGVGNRTKLRHLRELMTQYVFDNL